MRAEIRHDNGCLGPQACVTAVGLRQLQPGTGARTLNVRARQSPDTRAIIHVRMRAILRRTQKGSDFFLHGYVSFAARCGFTLNVIASIRAAMRTAFTMDGRTCRLQAVTQPLLLSSR
jgi:hypothetical protein